MASHAEKRQQIPEGGSGGYGRYNGQKEIQLRRGEDSDSQTRKIGGICSGELGSHNRNQDTAGTRLHEFPHGRAEFAVMENQIAKNSGEIRDSRHAQNGENELNGHFRLLCPRFLQELPPPQSQA